MKKILPSTSSCAVPLKVLAVLTAVVLLTHVALLRATPMGMGLSQSEAPPRAFITRAVELAPAVQAVAAPVKTETPSLANQRTNSQEAASQPTAAIEKIETVTPSPVVIAKAEQPSDVDQPPSAPPSSEPLNPVAAIASAKTYTIPGSVHFKYKVETNKFPFSANGELLWQLNGTGYDARLEISAFGQARVQTSRGQITPAGLAPLRFSDKYRSEVAAHFNRETGKVTFSANTPDATLQAGAQDRLSILVQLAAMIAGNPRHYPPGATVAIQTIGSRAADTWIFTVAQEEKLTLPGGEQVTLKLVRNPRQEYDQKVELWLAPVLGYLPARIRITEPNGDFIDQKWLSTEPL